MIGQSNKFSTNATETYGVDNNSLYTRMSNRVGNTTVQRHWMFLRLRAGVKSQADVAPGTFTYIAYQKLCLLYGFTVRLVDLQIWTRCRRLVCNCVDFS